MTTMYVTIFFCVVVIVAADNENVCISGKKKHGSNGKNINISKAPITIHCSKNKIIA